MDHNPGMGSHDDRAHERRRRDLRAWLRTCALFASLAASACTSTGTIEGRLTEAPASNVSAGGDAAPPAPTHEHVAFTWSSSDGALSGPIEATLPDGETFTGRYHEITTTTTVQGMGGVYGAWYGGPWMGPRWYWGGAWPYYGSTDEFVTHYSGRVVALLHGSRDRDMRCRFELEDGARGMKGGGTGECQLSDGGRITSIFAPSP